MKKFNLMAMSVLSVLCIISCKPKEPVIAVGGVSLNYEELSLLPGESFTLVATLTPSDASNQLVYWTTSNPPVVSVANGVVTAIKPGISIVTVTTDDGEKRASCLVTVREPEIEVPVGQETSPVFSSNGGTVTVKFKAPETWNASIINTRADSWCTLDPSSGPAGEASINISTPDNTGYEERYATVQIKSGKQELNIYVSQKQQDNLTLTTNRFELSAQGGLITVQLKSNIDFTYSVDDACSAWIIPVSSKAYSDYSLDFNVAPNESVDKREGVITVSGGSFHETIRVYQEGETPTLVLSQNEYNIASEGGEISIELSSNVAVEMSIPADVDWIKEDNTKTVSTCTFKLSVEANPSLEDRSAVLTFSNAELGLSEEVRVNQAGRAQIHVSELTLDKSSLELTEGDEAQLSAKVLPDNADNKNVSWKSSNTFVATVDANGKVTAVNAGSATITVTTDDGGKTASCAVTVKERVYPVESVSLDKTSLTLTEGDSETLTATINPSNATNKNVFWKSSNTFVATVDANGKVTAVKAGSATI